MLKGKIAFFDSGIGGLTVLRACMERLENYEYYYYGDNARAPYGNLPKERIRQYLIEAFTLFEDLKMDAVVLACNTATAVCMEELRERYGFPIIGTEPAVFPAAAMGGEVLVLATRTTVESERLVRLLDKACRAYPSTRFRVVACDELAGGIERGIVFEELKKYLPICNPSAVVLGCTHYVFLKNEVERFYNVPVFDGNDGVASRLKYILEDGKKYEIAKNFVKSRDERPLFDFSKKNVCFQRADAEEGREFFSTGLKKGFLLQKWQKISKNDKKTANFAHVYFLGSGEKINYEKCKQMFVVDKKSNWRLVGV